MVFVEAFVNIVLHIPRILDSLNTSTSQFEQGLCLTHLRQMQVLSHEVIDSESCFSDSPDSVDSSCDDKLQDLFAFVVRGKHEFD
jgi:hypothetical protein